MALAIGIGLAVVVVVVGSVWLINAAREPDFTGDAIDNLTVTETSTDAYEIAIPEGLELSDELQIRVLAPGEGTAMEDYDYAYVSTDHSTWNQGETVTLNPWASEVAGEDVLISVEDLRSELQLRADTELRPGTILLAVAPNAYFANRAPSLEITSGEAVLAVITIVS